MQIHYSYIAEEWNKMQMHYSYIAQKWYEMQIHYSFFTEEYKMLTSYPYIAAEWYRMQIDLFMFLQNISVCGLPNKGACMLIYSALLTTLHTPIIAYMYGFGMLTHCGLVTPYGDIDLGQHWLR